MHKLLVLLELLGKLGALEAIRERLPFRYRSNNASQPEHILLAFWLAVAAGVCDAGGVRVALAVALCDGATKDADRVYAPTAAL